MPASPAPLLLVLDGNSMLHRAYHAASQERFLDREGRPVWALRGLVGYVARAAAHLRPQAVIVGFDCPDHSERKVEYPQYKAQRAEKPAELVEQILAAPALLGAAGLCTVQPRALEADDVLASCAAKARAQGWRSILMTSDRDAFALIDETTSVLRIRNGGFDEAVLVDQAGLPDLCGVAPHQYRDFAALRGDPSDNLHGVRRFGASKAAKLLAAFGSLDAAWAAADRGDADSLRAAVGDHAAAELTLAETRERVERNRSLMRMRLDVAVPDLDSARLPLSYRVMRQALLARGINFGPSLWALVDGTPPVGSEDLAPETRPWVWRKPTATDRRVPIPGQLTLF